MGTRWAYGWLAGLALASTAGAAGGRVDAADLLVSLGAARFPDDPDAPGSVVRCRLLVTVPVGGHPDSVSSVGCDEPYVGAARRAVARWRWRGDLPGEALGTVLVAFQDPGVRGLDADLAGVWGDGVTYAPIRRAQVQLPDTVSGRLRGVAVDCRAVVGVAPNGLPATVATGGCDPAFQGAAIEALLQWRWLAHAEADRLVAVPVRVVFRKGVARALVAR